MLLLFALALAAASIKRVECTGSSTSDYGKFTLKASGNDAHLYFTNTVETAANKVHIVVSVPSCACIGAVDIQKLNQIDYMAMKDYAVAFGVYVNDGSFQDREACSLTTTEIQARTELQFNTLAGRMSSRRDSPFDSALLAAMLAPKPHNAERIEGAVLAVAIKDFVTHSYVKNHHKSFFGATSTGGILLTQGNVMLRPCTLTPWYQPWLFSAVNEHRLVKFTPPFTAGQFGATAYFGEEDATLFNAIVNRLIEEKKITEKHKLNLAANNGAEFYVRTYPFQAVFLPLRLVDQFAVLLEPFAFTRLCPYVYVPFIFQLLFDEHDWVHLKGTENGTIAMGDSLLYTCAGADTYETQQNTNTQAAQSLFYYAYEWCGGQLDVVYIVEKTKHMARFYFYEIAFFVLLLLLVMLLVCVMRRHMTWKNIQWIIGRTCCFFCYFCTNDYSRLSQEEHRDDVVPLVQRKGGGKGVKDPAETAA